MTDIQLYLKNLTGKDENKAAEAAKYLINGTDIDLYKALVNKADYLFDFVLENVYKRLQNAINNDNCKNIIKFFDVYSPYFDDFFCEILSFNANEDLTDEIFELLEKGNASQKTYAAKYFSYIPDTVALELLSKYAFCDDDALSSNAAEALGQMQDDTSFDIALNYIKSDDDFEKLKAVKFFVNYGYKYPMKEIFDALKTSKIPENIAGQIPYTEGLKKLLHSEFEKDALLTVAYIMSGVGEILPLGEIFGYELYDILENLIIKNKKQNDNSAIIALIILSAYNKFRMFTENSEYIFDEDKNTKNEIVSIFNLLKAQTKEFYDLQKQNLIDGIDCNLQYFPLMCNIISECGIKNAAERLKECLETQNETLICEILIALKNIGEINKTDKDSVLKKVTNPDIKAFIESLYE